jgi:prophage DNA circulation protein
MSWIERVKTDLRITCGEGTSFTPLYFNAQKSVEYNIAEFNFPNINGTLVARKSSRGRRYALELIFQGDDVLDVSDAFETAARDPRPWTMAHPFYGEVTVHPIGLEFDNSRLNVATIRGTVIETIGTVRPSTTAAPVDKVIEDKQTTDALISEAFADNVTPTPSDVNALSQQTSDIYADGSKIATGDIGAEYRNAFNRANSAISNATAQPLAAMNAIQQVISAPARFEVSVNERLNVLRSQFERLTNSIANLFTPNEKRTYQANAGTIITTTTEATVTGTYATAEDALATAQVVLSMYNVYVAALDTMQTLNGGEPDSYIPDAGALTAIDQLVNFAVSNMFDVALNSQQERAVILVEPSDPINLTHRFYGLDNADENLQRFIETNGISLSQMLELRAGTRVVYYV